MRRHVMKDGSTQFDFVMEKNNEFGLVLLLVEKIYSGVREWLGQGMTGAIGGELCSSAVVLLLPTILMGMTFSLLAHGACGKMGGLGRALSINTIGAAIAPFLFGVVLAAGHRPHVRAGPGGRRLPGSCPHGGNKNPMDDLSRSGRPLRAVLLPSPFDPLYHPAAARKGGRPPGRGDGIRDGSRRREPPCPPQGQQPLPDGSHLVGLLRPVAGPHSTPAPHSPEEGSFPGAGHRRNLRSRCRLPRSRCRRRRADCLCCKRTYASAQCCPLYFSRP